MKKAYYSGIAALLLCCFLAAAVPAAADMSPTETIQEAVDRIIVVLKDPKVNTKDGKSNVIHVLSDMADDYFAFDELTMRSVGKPWLAMSEEQRAEFIKSFRRLLELTYLQKIRQYDDEKVEYKRELVKGDKAMVLTNVLAKDSVYSVNYKLIKREGRWYVYDIIGENISLVKNYRQQFNEILHDGSVQDLIEKIKEKVAKLEASKDEPEQQ
ncbi:MlaC/ttg2D family ABC transporter substrate-binding protein [Salidesulfovibrio onnuriiensis]|uniref:MlaC/ttg2D family ABC transporter substrate-binding protein n=1 Tax=Salidesulfovibrio onnuriiensis TaxID=2583823 RepID=UPI0011CBEBFE|nr:ABC transporter substrate-binding protein [Salidesulfovibrio onnuriiensis]